MTATITFASAAALVLVVGHAARRVVLGTPRRHQDTVARTSHAGGPHEHPPARRVRPLRQARRLPAVAGRATSIAAAAFVALLIVGPFTVALAAALVLAARRGRPVLRQRRIRRQLDRELPDVIDLLVLSIRAGLTPHQAVRELAATAPEASRGAFIHIVHRLERGQPFADAISTLGEVLGDAAVGLADVLATAARYGLPIEPVLDQLALEARTTRRRSDEAAARKLPVLLSFPLVTCTLPSFVLLAIAPAVIAALSSLSGSAP